MGFSPREVDAFTLAEMRSLVRSWNALHEREEDAPSPPTDDEYFELLESVNGGGY